VWRENGDLEGFYIYLLHVSAHITLGLLFELWQSAKKTNKQIFAFLYQYFAGEV